MPRTVLTPINVPLPYSTGGVQLTWINSDNVNGNDVTLTGREILFVWNDTAAAVTVTVQSVADPYGRTGNVSRSVPAGQYYAFQRFPTDGWLQADGRLWIDTTAAIKVALLRLPT